MFRISTSGRVIGISGAGLVVGVLGSMRVLVWRMTVGNWRVYGLAANFIAVGLSAVYVQLGSLLGIVRTLSLNLC